MEPRKPTKRQVKPRKSFPVGNTKGDMRSMDLFQYERKVRVYNIAKCSGKENRSGLFDSGNGYGNVAGRADSKCYGSRRFTLCNFYRKNGVCKFFSGK